MALVVRNGATRARGGEPLRSENGTGSNGVPDLVMTPPRNASIKAKATVRKGEGSSNKHDEVIFLIELVKVAMPRSRGKRLLHHVHCTIKWVGPTNPSGRKRVEKVLHRTKTLKIDGNASAGVSSDALAIPQSDSGDYEDGADEVDCIEQVFTLNDGSLFLFKTTMKQLVNASIDSSSSEDTSSDVDADGIHNSGGLRIDIFEEPLDVLNSVYSALANNIAEKEANAITRESSSMTSFRLVGSAFLTPPEILSKCDEQRFEHDLMGNWRTIHGQHGSSARRMTPKKVDGGRLALRIRLASEFDVAFSKSLSENETTPPDGASISLQTTLIRSSGDERLKPAQLTTEMDENLLTAEYSVKAIGNLSPIAQEGVRYLFSNDTERRLLVKPHPDPNRPEETTWFTEEGLHNECYKPSINWIQAGQGGSGSLGKVFLEILECRGLPNTDAGGAVGNKTDAFISAVYGNIMVQTEVIDDSCSPMWMPWSSRAFVFQMGHPSTAIYIGVADYDVGPLEHECIGRVAIDMEKFFPGTVYTLTYNLYGSSNLTERGDDEGTITVRLRIEIPDERKYLMKGWKAPERTWVNSQQWKSHRVAKYCVDGPHDEEVFEMTLFRSYINELLTSKKFMSYAISDAMRSLVFWRGQVKVGGVWMPLHSAIVFYCSIHLVERPHLMPSFFLFGCGWVMIANMLHRANHPNPWRRGHSFVHYWNVLMHGESFHSAGKVIRPNQGHKESSKLDDKWKQRLADADAEYAKQAELDAKIKSISDDTIIRTKAKGNGALVDPISALAGAKLLPYQKRLSGYCTKVRYIRNVMNWNESVISFFTTLILFGSGFVALFIPWRFILLWASRAIVWGCLGPWMRLIDLFFHEEAEKQKTRASIKAKKLFHEQHKVAKSLREQALKMKAFRVKLFGKFITRLPEFHLTRHEDVPLPRSYAELYHSKEAIKTTKFVPSQDLSGTMIPMTGQDAAENEARKQKEKEGLLDQYQAMLEENPQLSSDSGDVDEAFELVSTEDGGQIICLHSASAEEADDTAETTDNAESTLARSSSVRDVAISDKAIQSALEKAEKDLRGHKEKKIAKTKWTFSAQIHVSFKKETVGTPPRAPALGNGGNNEMIEQMNDTKLIEQEDDVEEEGVEIVPFLGSASDYNAESETALGLEADNRVSVLYVKDDTNQTKDVESEQSDDNKVTVDALKRIRSKKAINDID